MRVAIVNDMPVAIEALQRIIQSNPAHKVIWTAKSGEDSVRLCKTETPDVVLMDLVMPGMSGAQATREIMKVAPCAILVVTATVAGNFQLVSEAMGNGAYDAVETPALAHSVTEVSPSASKLLAKLANVDKINQRLRGSRHAHIAITPPLQPIMPGNRLVSRLPSLPPLVAIGSSTGGPMALDAIFTKLGANFPAAILVAQHVGEEFTASLVQWLNERTKLQVMIAKSGDMPQAGTVHVASTGDHLMLSRDGTLRYTRDPADYPYRPSVDVLFNSLVESGCRASLAVLLTGIGNDGAKGLLRLRQAGWRTIAQDAATCVVYGMPQAAVKLGAAASVLPIDTIAANLEHWLAHPTAK